MIETTVWFYIIFALIVATILAWFTYHRYNKPWSLNRRILAVLRFVSAFLIILLLINPKTTQYSYENQLPPLNILVDRSASIRHLQQESNVANTLEKLKKSNLEKKFKVQTYQFGDVLEPYEDSSKLVQRTNIHSALSAIQKLNDHLGVTIVLTDGNQTYGSDYAFFKAADKQHIFPVVFGDTTQLEDLRIDKINTNKYAFLKNKYPVEILVSYKGKNEVKSKIIIYKNNLKIDQQNVVLSAQNNSLVHVVNIRADKIGIQHLRVELVPLEQEKNRKNNIKQVSLEVINEKSKIGIVSDFLHPDIAALKRTILSNEQRQVDILYPKNQKQAKVADYEQFVLYQPNQGSAKLLREIIKKQKPCFIITGSNTNWPLLKELKLGIEGNLSGNIENYQAVLNPNFNLYRIDQTLNFNSYPPLQDVLGEKRILESYQTILHQKIDGMELDEPLLAIYDWQQHKNAVLFGENFWQWRMQAFWETGEFSTFDAFFSKLFFLLKDNSSKSRLTVKYENYYYQNDPIKIDAIWYNEALEFDPNATLNLKLKGGKEAQVLEYNLLRKSNYYSVDLSGVAPGEYEFDLNVVGAKIRKTGKFTIIPFDVEAQFLTSNYQKLKELAIQNNGNPYVFNQIEGLVLELTESETFKTLQKETRKTVPLIDYKWLLALLAICLSMEWFMRKFIGLN